MSAPAKALLKVVSILYIVLGAVFLLLTVAALLFSVIFAALDTGWGEVISDLGGILALVLLFFAAVSLTIGIIGVIQSGKPSKALFFIVSGYIIGGLTFVGLMLLTGLLRYFPVWSMLCLVMPALFIAGGYINKSAAPK